MFVDIHRVQMQTNASGNQVVVAAAAAPTASHHRQDSTVAGGASKIRKPFPTPPQFSKNVSQVKIKPPKGTTVGFSSDV